MGCDIIFEINGALREDSEKSPLSITIENSKLKKYESLESFPDVVQENLGLSLKNIAKELSSKPSLRKQLADIIKNLSDSSSRHVSLDDIKRKGIIGNYKYHNLKLKYGSLNYPNLKTPYNPTILLVDKLNYRGKNLLGVVQKTEGPEGEEIYIIKDSEKAVEQFAHHLAVRDAILNEDIDNKELAKLMPELEKKGIKFNSLKELLLDYIVNSEKYKDVLVDKGFNGLLHEIINDIRYKNRLGFSSPLDREFNSKLYKISGTKNDHSMSRKTFLKIVKAFNPELLENLTSQDLKQEAVIRKVFNDFSGQFDELAVKLCKIGDKDLIFNRVFTTLEYTEGFTYESIKKLTIIKERYRGYNIYEYTKVLESGETIVQYLFNADRLTPKSFSKGYDSIDRVRDLIDDRAENMDTFASRFNLGFRVDNSFERVNFVYNNSFHPEGSVVQVLNIKLDRDTALDISEQALFSGDKGLKDFFQEFKKQLSAEQYDKLTDVIQSIEDAGIFTYLINARTGSVQSLRDLPNGTDVDEILDEILSAKDGENYKYYYIESCEGSVGNYFMKVIPYSKEVEMNEKYQLPTPTIGLILEVIDKLTDKFGINAEMLTDAEIAEQFPDIKAGSKAFIRDGKIYINGSLATSNDVVHEYTHLILGVLKALNYDMYEKLLDRIANSNESKIKVIKEYVSKAYKYLARQDFNEEVFAIAFSNFLAGKDTDSMFEVAKKEIDENLKGILTLATDEDFNSLYKGRVDNIFQTFSKDIGRFTSGLEFGKGKIYREAANWISKLIEAKNIIERCKQA